MSLDVPESALTFDQLARLANFDRDVADALDEALASSSGSFSGYENAADFGAVGDGVVDDTAALQALLDAAAVSRKPIWLDSDKTYKVVKAGGVSTTAYALTFAGTSLRLYGNGATIVYPSSVDGTSAHTSAIKFTSGATNSVRVSGLNFVGDAVDSYVNNQGSALYFLGTCYDTTIDDCTFTNCGTPITFLSDGTAPGRAIISKCRFYACPNSISTPYRSIITNCIFDFPDKTGTRSHCVYLYGAVDGCVISNNVFHNSDSQAGTYAIQIRATSARYNHRQGFIIANNMFDTCTAGIWCGSDNTTVLSGATITGNTFLDVTTPILAYGLSDSLIFGNTIESTWEHANSGSSAITTNHGNMSVSTQYANSEVTIANNRITDLHPYFGTVTVDSIPTAGDTVTVGTVTYTWRSAPTLAGEIAIGGSTTSCATVLTNALRGNALNAYNKVLRTPQDAFSSTFTYDGSATNKVVIVSSNTFALSQTGTALTIVAAAAHQPWASSIKAEAAFWPVIQNNTLKDVRFFDLERCVGATVQNNTLIGTQILGLGNVLSLYEGNRFCLSHTREIQYPSPNRWMTLTDGFYVSRNNGEADVVPQQYQSASGNGYAGYVPVGDGTARCRLYYGVESATNAFSSTFPFRWADNDQVKLVGGASGTQTFTFKRSSPGAGQFNTADSLLALINATTDYSAAYVDFTNTGGDLDPKVMIEIKYKTIGTAGNSCYLQILPAAVEGPDYRSVRTCGVILLDRSSARTNLCYFLGGSAAADKTVIWSPIAGRSKGVFVQGVDAASQALAPVVYQADITYGVAAVATHGVAAGTEKFFYRVG